jgi:protein-S-isoprenylcysteine O-methyltransferase Ste14
MNVLLRTLLSAGRARAVQIVRNPMYLGVGTILLGEAIAFHSKGLAIYLGVWTLCVHALVLIYEDTAKEIWSGVRRVVRACESLDS